MKLLLVYVDLQKAFDTVDHINILLYKLYNCGVRGIAHKWFVNYLYNRKQFTSVNNTVSMLKNVTCGVPQGSVIGPLLFVIYVNDSIQVKLFADDTNLFLSGIDISELICRSNNCLESLNRLHMNFEKKTNVMVFPISKGNAFIISFNGFPIAKLHSCRYLGLHIDDELTWKSHIDVVYNKLQG